MFFTFYFNYIQKLFILAIVLPLKLVRIFALPAEQTVGIRIIL